MYLAYLYSIFSPQKLKTALYGVMGVKGFKGSILNWGTRECSMLIRGSSRGRDVGGGRSSGMFVEGYEGEG